MSRFWQKLQEAMGTQLDFSTAYHPQTNGQTECMNQEIEHYLRLYINYKQNNWHEWLPICKFVYND